MSRELGRISGPLLAENLLRQGINLAFETDLLFLDVVNGRIGIRTDTPTRDLLINSAVNTTNLIVDDLITTPGFVINDAETIRWFSGDINLTASNYVFADNIRTDNLNIQDNVISSITPNTNIDLRTNGTGKVEIFANTNITGSLYTPNDITLDGNVVIGDSPSDVVVIGADIDSDVIPYRDNTHSLGSITNRWGTVYSYLMNGQLVDTGSINIPSLSNLALRQGNIWYIAANGSDDNQGNHQNGPFATVAKALSVAVSGDLINIYPGSYVETFPLTVPQGVSVNGSGIRAVVISPTEETKSKDAFLLNGETTVENLTVKDFYYDSAANTGYAFRFAPGINVTTRSPYIKNCTVITSIGTSPAGFGALVDGSVANSNSKEAAMLFHAITMIIPEADGITVTNGARVEWLNSFTYYANRGIHLTEGTLGFASLGVKFGAEMRSINSANVYGTYGAVAEGPHTIAYLIGHNFGYIGAGLDSSNDLSLVIQENETVEINSGKIYYQSMDQTGDFRVGDTFHADFQTGLITINGVSVTAGGISSINFADADSETNINATLVNTDNIKFSGNTLSSLYGPVNLKSATSNLNLTQNVLINKDMHVVGFLHLDGELTLGNQPTDIVEFNAPVEFDFIPRQHNQYTIGTNLKRWLKVYTTETRISDTVIISGNTITTATTNTDLRLTAIAGNKISVVDTDVELDQNLTVSTTTNLKDLNVTGLITQYGNVIRTGDTNQTGNVNQTGNLTVTSTAQFDDVKFENNNVTSVATLPATDLDLIFKASGTGKVIVPSDNVVVENDVTVGNNAQVSIWSINKQIELDSLSTGDILIQDNVITTTIGNNDLRLEVAGAGKLSVPLDNVEFDQTLTVNGTSTLKSVNIGAVGVGNAKTLTHVGNYLLTGAINQTGDRQISGTLGVASNVYFKNIDIINNTISTKGLTPLDLVLKAVGTGIVKSLKPVYLGQTLGVTGTTYTSDISNSSTVTSDIFTTGDISVDNNVITTTQANSNLILSSTNVANKIYAPNNNVSLGQNLTVLGTSNFSPVVINGKVTHYGTLLRTGNTVQTGAYQLDNITNNSDVFFQNISIIKKRISTRTSGSDLDLRAASTGKINVASDNVYFNQALRVDGILTTSTINNTTNTTTSNIFKTSGIEIDDNFIRATVTDSNLVLSGNGTGGAKLEKLKFNTNIISTESNNDNIVIAPGTAKNVRISSTTALKLPVGATTDRPTGIQGDWRFNSNDSLFGGWSTARRTMAGVYSADRRTYARAHPTANTISFVANLVPTMDVLSDRLRLNGLTIDNVQIDNNTFTAIPSNTDLLIQPNGTGTVVANKIKFTNNLWVNTDTTAPLVIKHTADGHLKFGGTLGIVIPAGNTATQPVVPEVGDLRYNTDDEAAEIWEGTRYIPITGTGDIATGEIVQELGDIWSLILG